MTKSDSTNTTNPSGGPTPAEMETMWLAARKADWEEGAEDYRAYEKYRARTQRALYGEAA